MKIFAKLGWAVSFLLFYAKSLVIANLRVARDVLSPKFRLRPGFLRVPLKSTSDMEILALSNLVTMTPGTLSLDVSEDRAFLHVHYLYLDDVEESRAAVGEKLQKRVLGGFQ